ncbi:hypothetical protein BVRB_3g055830 [Beta vulgaris subsp. vulgaris]|uniref:Protein LOW PSII ACCUMULATION 2, chloroplastic n=1 Tax=Beta vulgaris subsp. vulgaris TaxID=3555 RepID=A0A0J8FJ32_BETVV|nr:hypothetical protein BVRB_3g055830 [Beta vulgaris subsp. vulgaris]
MALLTFQSSSYFTNNPNFLLYKAFPYLPTKTRFIILSQNSSSSSSSQSSKPTINNNLDSIEQPSNNDSDKKPISSTGQGFGSPQSPKPSSTTGNKKGKRERASIIRRNPVEKPALLDKKIVEEESVNEKAFLLTWLGLGGVIFVQGIALASSGFLPEEWDKFFVKFLYPSFTPTVFLFVFGTVIYGVLKYFQNEDVTNQK